MNYLFLFLKLLIKKLTDLLYVYKFTMSVYIIKNNKLLQLINKKI
jgi:hypothetical protein